jgi:rod shape determining protein RodA
VFDWKILYRFDYLTFLLALCLAGFGLVVIGGAGGEEGSGLFISQLKRVIVALTCLFIVVSVEYRFFVRYAPVFYGLALVGLIMCFIPVFQRSSHGATSWISIAGFMQIQPGELAKLATILMLARVLSTRKEQWNGLWGVMRPLLIGIIPALLVLVQPDLGTAIVFGPVTLIMMFVAGMPVTYFVILFSPALCLLGISHDIIYILIWLALMTGILLMAVLRQIHWSIWMPFLLISVVAYGMVFTKGESVWEKLPEHQKGRIVGYLNPEFDPSGTNYNINQSKIALGSGGFWGKGIGKGTQSNYKFLPEFKHDFIFSILGEQTGFLGSVIVLGLFLLLIIRGFDTAMETKTLQGSLIAAGVVSLFFTHIFINVGMVTGILPVTGLPLTFISYGGTFMLSSMIGVGLLINIRMRTTSELLKDSFSGGRPTMAIPTKIVDDF